MVVTNLDGKGALHSHSPLDAQLQATLTLVPAHVWYASPNGALTFVNQGTADYLGLPDDHLLRFGTNTGADWDSHITFLHPMIANTHAESGRTVYARAASAK
jgi:hypothetical protein